MEMMSSLPGSPFFRTPEHLLEDALVKSLQQASAACDAAMHALRSFAQYPARFFRTLERMCGCIVCQQTLAGDFSLKCLQASASSSKCLLAKDKAVWAFRGSRVLLAGDSL